MRREPFTSFPTPFIYARAVSTTRIVQAEGRWMYVPIVARLIPKLARIFRQFPHFQESVFFLWVQRVSLSILNKRIRWTLETSPALRRSVLPEQNNQLRFECACGITRLRQTSPSSPSSKDKTFLSVLQVRVTQLITLYHDVASVH